MRPLQRLPAPSWIEIIASDMLMPYFKATPETLQRLPIGNAHLFQSVRGYQRTLFRAYLSTFADKAQLGTLPDGASVSAWVARHVELYSSLGVGAAALGTWIQLPPSHPSTTLSCLRFRFGLRRQLGIPLAPPRCRKGTSGTHPYDGCGHHALRYVKSIHTKRR